MEPVSTWKTYPRLHRRGPIEAVYGVIYVLIDNPCIRGFIAAAPLKHLSEGGQRVAGLNEYRLSRILFTGPR